MNSDIKAAMRIKNKASYRSGKDNLAELASKNLLTKSREVLVLRGSEEYIKVNGFSIVMAAKALGKSVIQIRSWISKGYIPEPVLQVKNYGYFVYDSREMQIIRKHLYRYTKKGVSYLTKNSLDFIGDLNTEIWNYRGNQYGS